MFFGFDFLPIAEDFGGVFGVPVAEDVWVAADHFLVDFTDNVVDSEAALFVGDLRMEEDLKEKITEFFGELGVVCAIKGVEDFVGFFDEIRAESGVSLFAIPGAAVGSAEAGHDGNQFLEGGTDMGKGD